MGYTRVTVLGSTHKADLVLPDDEPLGTLLPQLLQLLRENVPGGEELALSTLSGERLDLGTSMSDQEVAHGSMLRLTSIDEAPHAPEVADVTDAVALTRDDLRDRWTPRSAATVSAIAAALLSFIICALTLPPTITENLLEGRYQLIGIGVLLGGAMFLARRGQPLPALVFSGATLGAMPPLLQATGDLTPQAIVLVAAGTGWLVDNHVLRVSNRLGLAKGKDPLKVELQLQKVFPKEIWSVMHHRLILHGRYCCKARNPQCDRCGIFDYCPKIGVE